MTTLFFLACLCVHFVSMCVARAQVICGLFKCCEMADHPLLRTFYGLWMEWITAQATSTKWTSGLPLEGAEHNVTIIWTALTGSFLSNSDLFCSRNITIRHVLCARGGDCFILNYLPINHSVSDEVSAGRVICFQSNLCPR